MKTDWVFDDLPQAADFGETGSLGKNKGEMNKNRIETFHHLYCSQEKSHINPPWKSVLPEKIIKGNVEMAERAWTRSTNNGLSEPKNTSCESQKRNLTLMTITEEGSSK